MRKMRSRTGASMLFAILVFMMCILAGTGALTAAAANAGRYTHLRFDQQRTLSVSSAANLLRDELAGHTFTATLTTKVEQEYNTDNEAIGDANVDVYWTKDTAATHAFANDTDSVKYENHLSPLLREHFMKLFLFKMKTGLDTLLGTNASSSPFYMDSAPTFAEKTLTITLDDEDHIYPVVATMKVGGIGSGEAADFDIRIVFRLQDNGDAYAVTLTALATTEGVKSTVTEETKNNYEVGTGVYTGKTVTTTTEYTFTVDWLEENAQIDEGVLS